MGKNQSFMLDATFDPLLLKMGLQVTAYPTVVIPASAA